MDASNLATEEFTLPSDEVMNLMIDIWHRLGAAEGEVDACEAVGVLAQVMGMIVSSIKGRDERRSMADNCQYVVAHCMTLGIEQGDKLEMVN
jgi:hypothetical protein